MDEEKAAGDICTNARKTGENDGITGAAITGDANEREPDRFLTLDVTSLGLRHGTPVYALRVRGDSMTGAAILDGDIVFLTPREPRPRDIVAALIDGESTLKRFIRHEGRTCLRAENPRYPDLLPAVDLTIQGVMVGLLRATV